MLAPWLVYILRCAFDTATPRLPTTVSTLSCSSCSCFCVRSSRRLTTPLRYSRSTPSPARRGSVRRGFYRRPDEPADISLFIGDFCVKDAVFSRIPVSSLLTSNHAPLTCESLNAFRFITFRMSRRRREMYCGHPRLCVCLSAAACLHYCQIPVSSLLMSNHAPPIYEDVNMLSPVRLSVVCNVRAPYSGGSNFRQYFYLCHPLTFTENFTEIVPGEPLRRGS